MTDEEIYNALSQNDRRRYDEMSETSRRRMLTYWRLDEEQRRISLLLATNEISHEEYGNRLAEIAHGRRALTEEQAREMGYDLPTLPPKRHRNQALWSRDGF